MESCVQIYPPGSSLLALSRTAARHAFDLRGECRMLGAIGRERLLPLRTRGAAAAAEAGGEIRRHVGRHVKLRIWKPAVELLGASHLVCVLSFVAPSKLIALSS